MSSIDPGVDIGHVHLKVSDLDRAIAFYRDVLGFDLMEQMPGAARWTSKDCSRSYGPRSFSR